VKVYWVDVNPEIYIIIPCVDKSKRTQSVQRTTTDSAIDAKEGTYKICLVPNIMMASPRLSERVQDMGRSYVSTALVDISDFNRAPMNQQF
jgi:hypothetical protein